jgi:hypothetical protein
MSMTVIFKLNTIYASGKKEAVAMALSKYEAEKKEAPRHEPNSSLKIVYQQKPKVYLPYPTYSGETLVYAGDREYFLAGGAFDTVVSIFGNKEAATWNLVSYSRIQEGDGLEWWESYDLIC